MDSKIKRFIKSKEFKNLIYFIIIALIIIVVNNILEGNLNKLYKYDWKGADVDGDGIVEDPEGYAYLFRGFAKDITGEIGSGLKVGSILLPLTIKIFAIPICLIFQIIAIVVKKKKRIFSNIALALNLTSSILALSLGIFNSILIELVIIFDIVSTIILLYYNNKGKKEKIDLDNIEWNNKN